MTMKMTMAAKPEIEDQSRPTKIVAPPLVTLLQENTPGDFLIRTN